MSSKIKVLQVIPRLGYGGAETGCYDLAHYLAEKDCKSYIVTSGGPLLKFIKKNKVKVIRLPVHSKNPLLMIINAIILLVVIFTLNIDIDKDLLMFDLKLLLSLKLNVIDGENT